MVEAALIARGPYLAPGRIVVPKSNGSPIIATSGFTSSNSLWLLTHGRCKNVLIPTNGATSGP